MSSYQPPHWAGLNLPAQTGGLRLTGPIPLNVANEIKISAPEQIYLSATNKINFIYPVAVTMRRMDYEVLRLQADFQKRPSANGRNPAHFLLRLKAPDGQLYEVVAEDLAKPPQHVAQKARVEESPFSLDLEYAYQGVTVSDWEIERSRAGAQATTREYIFDLRVYFPQLTFNHGAYALQLETLGLQSNEVETLIQLA